MSEESENDLSLDLQFLPEWAQEDSGKNKFEGHSGGDRREQVRGRGQKRNNQHRRDEPKGRGAERSKGKDGRGDKRDYGGRKSGFREASSSRRESDGREGKGGRFQRPKAPQLELRVDFVPDEQGGIYCQGNKTYGQGLSALSDCLVDFESTESISNQIKFAKQVRGE